MLGGISFLLTILHALFATHTLRCAV